MGKVDTDAGDNIYCILEMAIPLFQTHLRSTGARPLSG